MKTNREIKFRGKDKNTGLWVYGDLIHKPAMPEINVEAEICIGSHIVIPETVGQFTGLLDKNDKKIYENDIVKWIDSDSNIRKDIIKFSHGGFHLCNNSYSIGSYIHNNIEVIGNVFTNKNLLENGESGTEN